MTEINGGTSCPIIARCEGVGYEEDGVMSWREGCEDCLRRAMPPSGNTASRWITPPKVIAFWCAYHIPMEVDGD